MSSPFQLPRPLLYLACGAFRRHSLRRAIVTACAVPLPAVTSPPLSLPLLPLLPARKEPAMRLGHPGSSPIRGPHLGHVCRGPLAVASGTFIRTRASSELPHARVTMGPFRLHVRRTRPVSLTVPALPLSPAAPPGSCRGGAPLCCEETGPGGGGPRLVAGWEACLSPRSSPSAPRPSFLPRAGSPQPAEARVCD